MPFYQCIAPIGVITADMKQEIVDEITRIHCEATGGLPRFVQVQFDEVNPENVFQNRKLSSAIRLHVRMRAGRPAEVRHRMMTNYTNLLSRVTGVPIVDIMIGIVETSYENVMESGLRLPAPGDEGSWKAKFANM
jgi:phenylpyruvate tautomerase PptA (4-oxalocrotonate tautomerase family)